MSIALTTRRNQQKNKGAVAMYKEYSKGTIVSCNACGNEWRAEKNFQTLSDLGDALRIETFLTCPHCGQTDTHWLFQSNVGRPIRIIRAHRAIQRHYTVYLLRYETDADVFGGKNGEPLFDEKKVRENIRCLGSEMARFFSENDAVEYAELYAKRFGISHPDYFAIAIA